MRSLRTLYGRTDENRRVEAAIRDENVRLVLATGPSGIGKSALLRRALDRAAAEGALTGAGKHVEGDPTGAGFEPLIQALEKTLEAGLGKLLEPEAGLASLSAALGPSASVLATLGGGALRALPMEKTAADSPGAGAEERLFQAIGGLVNWLTGFGLPIIILIDDWGRSSPDVRRLYLRLLRDARLERLTILATQRDTEQLPIGSDLRAVEIDLGPLDETAIDQLARDFLGATSATRVDALSPFLGSKQTPFEILQRLRALEASSAVRVDGDLLHIDRAAAYAAGILEPEAHLLANALAPSDSAAQLLETLALFGDAAPLSEVQRATALDGQDIAHALSALRPYGVVQEHEGALEFAHDRLRAAVLARLSAPKRHELAARVAESLRSAAWPMLTQHLRTIMLRRRLDAGLADADSARWVRPFCIGASEHRRLGAHESAVAFADAALQLAGGDNCSDFDVLYEAIFASLYRRDFALAEEQAERLLRAAEGAPARAQAHELCVLVARLSDNFEIAIRAARRGLADVGIKVPDKVSWLDVGHACARVLLSSVRTAEGRGPLSPEDLAIQAPILRSMNAIAPILFEKDIKLAVVFGAGAINQRTAAGTAVGASAYAFVCSMTGWRKRAGRWADLSERLQGPHQPLRAVAMQYATAFGHWYARSRAQMRDRAERMLALAYAEGDLGLVVQANRDRVYDSLLSESPLAHTEALADHALELAEHFYDASNALPLRAIKQLVQILRRGSPTPWRLEGAHLTAQHKLDAQRAELRNAERTIIILEATLATAFGAYEACAALYDAKRKEFDRARALTQFRTWTFLTGLSLARSGRRPDRASLAHLREAARMNPQDNLHRLTILEAESARLRGSNAVALARYAAAADQSCASGCLLECAIVCAAAAEGAAMLGHPDAGERFQKLALKAWTDLGAEGAKAGRLTAPQAAKESIPPDQMETLRLRYEEREKELAAAKFVLERESESKSRFIATIAHELRTPLQGLQATLEQGDRGSDASLLAAVNHVMGLVNDLTDVGALDSGLISFAARPFEPGDLVRQMAELFTPIAAQQGRRMTFKTPGPSLRLVGDERRIKQIVSNLVQNALRHGAGAIELAANWSEQQQGGQVTLNIVVSDEGQALSAQALVFEPKPASGAPGLGLGLSVSRRLAIAMGGALEPDFSRNKSSFRLTLPLSQTDSASQPAPRAARRVLVPEDDAFVRRALVDMLLSLDCAVTEATNGREARSRLMSGAFDFALLDINMPEETGIELARAARGQPWSPATIALMSAGALPGGEASDVADNFLQKPISLSDLRCLLGEPDPDSGRSPYVSANIPDALIHVRDNVGRLRNAAHRGDRKEVSDHAHRLAGLAGLANLAELKNAASELEQKALGEEDFSESLALLERAVSDTMRA